MKLARCSCYAVTFALLLCLGIFLWSALWPSRSSDPQAAGPSRGQGTAEAGTSLLPEERHAESGSLAAAGQWKDGISARAVLRSVSGNSRELEALDGEFARLKVAGGARFRITLRSRRFATGAPVRIEAGHGGSLNRRMGPVVGLEAGAGGEVTFDFAVGEHRGLYTVDVSQGPQRELFEFWVGPEPPLGDPGPRRAFSAPSPRS